MTGLARLVFVGALLLTPIGASADQPVKPGDAPRSVTFPCDSGQANAIAVKVHDDDHILLPDGTWRFVGTSRHNSSHIGMAIYQNVDTPSTYLAIAAPYSTKLFAYAYRGQNVGDHCQAAWPERDGDVYISILQNPQISKGIEHFLSVACTKTEQPSPQYVQITGNTNGCKHNVTNVVKMYP